VEEMITIPRSEYEHLYLENKQMKAEIARAKGVG
jgi:hypothetical protein